MPRTKGFEPEAALEAAMELFWSRGYEATSMRDLLDGMGIGRGSFYDTFGDKRSLFLAALDRFEETRTAWAIETLENSESALGGIEEVFERTVRNLTERGPRRGCLMANSAVELAPHDAEIEARIARYVRRLGAAFEDAVARARQSGELSTEHDPKALARFLVNSIHGLRVLARSGADQEALEDAARVTLEVLR
jgi:TetR/AcrR family transcriptional regulator, transcriptional repressor for nem operon